MFNSTITPPLITKKNNIVLWCDCVVIFKFLVERYANDMKKKKKKREEKSSPPEIEQGPAAW